MKAFFRETIITLILALVIFFTLQSTLKSFEIHLSSMENSLHEGQRVLVSKITYRFHEPERGDVIIFRTSNNQRFIKRIIALPGESVEIRGGTVYIHQNGTVFPLDEPYIKEQPNNDFQRDIIPENEYFVLGDNRNNSNDSRKGWTVKREDIIGKAWLSIWRPEWWGLAPNYSFDE